MGVSLAKISGRQTLAVRHSDQSYLELLHLPGHHYANQRPERDALLTVQEHWILELCPQNLVSLGQPFTAMALSAFRYVGYDANIQLCIMQEVPMQRRRLLLIQ